MSQLNIMGEVIKDLGIKDESEIVEKEVTKDDEEIEKEFDEDLGEDLDENLDENLDEDEDEDEEDEILDGDEEEDDYLNNTIFKPKKPSIEDKRRYAFEKQRKELKEKEKKINELDDIAQTYGFKDHDEMLTKLRDDAMDKKARESNVDPKIYKEMQEQSRKIAELESQRDSEMQAVKVKKFLGDVDAFSEKYSLSDSEKNMLIDQLDDSGFTIDTLVKIKNPEKIFTGYMSDKVLARYQQNMIERNSKKRSLEEKKFIQPKGTSSKADYDSLLSEMFKTKKNKY